MTDVQARPAPEATSDQAEREAVLARLAARGLVRTKPSPSAQRWGAEGEEEAPAERQRRLVYPPGLQPGDGAGRGPGADRPGPAGGAPGRRRAAEESVRRRRALLAATAAVVVALALGVALLAAVGATSKAQTSRATCARYDVVRSQLANGAMSGPQLAAALGQVRSQAAAGTPAVAAAATRLAGAGAPGTADFLIASTVLADACDAVPRG